MENRTEELAKAHWDYIEKLLITHDVMEDERKIIGFHYKTAFIHGYKHRMAKYCGFRKGNYKIGIY